MFKIILKTVSVASIIFCSAGANAHDRTGIDIFHHSIEDNPHLSVVAGECVTQSVTLPGEWGITPEAKRYRFSVLHGWTARPDEPQLDGYQTIWSNATAIESQGLKRVESSLVFYEHNKIPNGSRLCLKITGNTGFTDGYADDQIKTLEFICPDVHESVANVEYTGVTRAEYQAWSGPKVLLWQRDYFKNPSDGGGTFAYLLSCPRRS